MAVGCRKITIFLPEASINMYLDALGKLLTVCVFGGAGWLIAKRFRTPVALWTWALLILAALAGIFVKFWVASVLGFTIHANWVIVSCCLGVLLGLAIRSLASRPARKSGR